MPSYGQNLSTIQSTKGFVREVVAEQLQKFALPAYTPGFISLGGAGQAPGAIAFGNLGITFPANSYTSNQFTIPHGLGRVPQFVGSWVALNAFQAVLFSSGTWQFPDATNIYLWSHVSATYPTAIYVTLYWIVFG